MRSPPAARAVCGAAGGGDADCAINPPVNQTNAAAVASPAFFMCMSSSLAPFKVQGVNHTGFRLSALGFGKNGAPAGQSPEPRAHTLKPTERAPPPAVARNL